MLGIKPLQIISRRTSGIDADNESFGFNLIGDDASSDKTVQGRAIPERENGNL